MYSDDADPIVFGAPRKSEYHVILECRRVASCELGRGRSLLWGGW